MYFIGHSDSRSNEYTFLFESRWIPAYSGEMLKQDNNYRYMLQQAIVIILPHSN